MLYGVLSHQGAYILHEKVMRKLGRNVIRVFTRDDIHRLDALIIPGGESTTIEIFFNRLDLWEYIRSRIIDGLPVFGTCAGIIMLAKEVHGSDQRTIGVLDISVERMGFGRQVDSFEANLHIPILGEKPLNGVFIRAPRIIRSGEGVEVLASYNDEPVAVRSGNIWGTTFHPELSNDLRFHKCFIEMTENSVVTDN